MHQDFFGKTNGLASQSLDARSQGQMLALDFLSVGFPHSMVGCL